MNEWFRRLAHRTGEIVGSSLAFTLALTVIVVWLLLGPHFHFSDTWQLVVNTATSVLTFLIVFLIQNMQNRDAKAIHLKLDELIRSVKSARNSLVDLEELSDAELAKLQSEFEHLRQTAEKRSQSRPTHEIR